VNGLESAVAHAPSTTEKNETAEPGDAGNKTILDQPSQASLTSDAPNLKSEDVPAAVGLVQEKGAEEEEDNKTIINAPLPTVEFKPVRPDSPVKTKTNGEIDHSNHDHVNGVVEDKKVDSKVQTLENGDVKEAEETDGRQYVGDGTWEEKTWKELVRLREDMFWARVGGFRG